MFQEDGTNACLAVLSSRCLEFIGKDKRRLVGSTCPRRHRRAHRVCGPVLFTRINLRTLSTIFDASTLEAFKVPDRALTGLYTLPLARGSRLSVRSGDSDIGSLEIRSEPSDGRAGQLAYFGQYNKLDRSITMFSRKLGSQRNAQNDEVINLDLVSAYTVSVFIADNLANTVRGAFRTLLEDG